MSLNFLIITVGIKNLWGYISYNIIKYEPLSSLKIFISYLLVVSFNLDLPFYVNWIFISFSYITNLVY